uniref:Uncharacterized protein n=1 Tax=Megaselia scalaris TaxID=36166 RepID=T1H305_MEGSC
MFTTSTTMFKAVDKSRTIILIFLWIYGYIIFNSFNSILCTFLTTLLYEPIIKTEEDLLKSSLKIIASKFRIVVFRDKLFKKFIETSTYEEFTSAMNLNTSFGSDIGSTCFKKSTCKGILFSPTSSSCKDKNGNLITDKQKVLKRSEQFFIELLIANNGTIFFQIPQQRRRHSTNKNCSGCWYRFQQWISQNSVKNLEQPEEWNKNIICYSQERRQVLL